MSLPVRVAAMAALAVALGAVSHFPDRPTRGIYVIAGARVLQPAMAAWLQAFAAAHPEFEAARVNAGGTTAALRDLKGHNVNMVMADRLPGDGERGLPVEVAREALIVAVHPSRPPGGVTRAQLREILVGRTKDWGALGAPPAPIVVFVSREVGVAEALESEILGGEWLSSSVRQLDSGAAVRLAVAAEPRALGIVPATAADGDGSVRIWRLDGAAPAGEATAAAGGYRLARPLYLVFPSNPAGTVYEELARWIREPAGNAITVAHHLLPAVRDIHAIERPAGASVPAPASP